jgi:hypothetical protein
LTSLSTCGSQNSAQLEVPGSLADWQLSRRPKKVDGAGKWAPGYALNVEGGATSGQAAQKRVVLCSGDAIATTSESARRCSARCGFLYQIAPFACSWGR